MLMAHHCRGTQHDLIRWLTLEIHLPSSTFITRPKCENHCPKYRLLYYI
uniref:Uncharacterized protein n=1 Tax=Rhizophora mucronata TaxID=61149 RepID=A0A2P2NHN4_RHIMU